MLAIAGWSNGAADTRRRHGPSPGEQSMTSSLRSDHAGIVVTAQKVPDGASDKAIAAALAGKAGA